MSRLFQGIAILLQFAAAAGCCYNTDCTYWYTGQDACFMGAVYTLAGESPYEGFCYDGACWGFGGGGSCQKKKSLGESCLNAGGNYDNNYCVTGLCSSSSGVCELRKTGCRSASACIQQAFSYFADAFGTAMAAVLPNSGSSTGVTTSGACADTDSDACYMNANINPFEQPFDLSGLEVQLADGLTLQLSGTVTANIDPTIDFDQTTPSLEASVGYVVQNSVTATLVGTLEGNWGIDQEYLLTDGTSICATPTGTTCSPKKVFSAAVKVGHFSFILEVEVQLTAYVSGKASASAGFEAAATFTADFSDTVGLKLKPADKKPLTLDAIDSVPTATATMDSVTASAKTHADLVVVLGAEVTVSVNGIGAEFAVQSKLTMEVDAQVDGDGCANGRAGVSAGVDIGTYVPRMNIGEAMFSAVASGLAGTTARRRLEEAEKAEIGEAAAAAAAAAGSERSEQDEGPEQPKKQQGEEEVNAPSAPASVEEETRSEGGGHLMGSRQQKKSDAAAAAAVAHDEGRRLNREVDYGWVPADPNDQNGAYCYVNYLDLENSATDQTTAATDQQSIVSGFLNFAGCSKAGSLCSSLVDTAANSAYTSCSSGDNPYDDVEHSCSPFKTVTSNFNNVCDDGDADNACFAAEDTVTLPSGQAKPLRNVRVGDEILTANAQGELSFSKVVFLPHPPTNNVKSEFVEVRTSSGKRVRATAKHLLMTCDGSLVRAASVTAAREWSSGMDCLQTVDGPENVTWVGATVERGFATVVAEKEFVVVNGVLASPFAAAHTVVHWYYNLHRAAFKYWPWLATSAPAVSANLALGSAVLYLASVLDTASLSESPAF